MLKKDPRNLSTIPAKFFLRKEEENPDSFLLKDPEELRHYRSVVGTPPFRITKSDFSELLVGFVGRSRAKGAGAQPTSRSVSLCVAIQIRGTGGLDRPG